MASRGPQGQCGGQRVVTKRLGVDGAECLKAAALRAIAQPGVVLLPADFALGTGYGE